MKKVLATTLLALVSACAYPSHQATQGTDKGLLTFPNAAPGSRVLIDGQDVGLASNYDQKHPLGVAPGTHRVNVMSDGRSILDKKYFVEAGTMVAVQ